MCLYTIHCVYVIPCVSMLKTSLYLDFKLLLVQLYHGSGFYMKQICL